MALTGLHVCNMRALRLDVRAPSSVRCVRAVRARREMDAPSGAAKPRRRDCVAQARAHVCTMRVARLGARAQLSVRRARAECARCKMCKNGNPRTKEAGCRRRTASRAERTLPCVRAPRRAANVRARAAKMRFFDFFSASTAMTALVRHANAPRKSSPSEICMRGHSRMPRRCVQICEIQNCVWYSVGN